MTHRASESDAHPLLGVRSGLQEPHGAAEEPVVEDEDVDAFLRENDVDIDAPRSKWSPRSRRRHRWPSLAGLWHSLVQNVQRTSGSPIPPRWKTWLLRSLLIYFIVSTLFFFFVAYLTPMSTLLVPPVIRDARKVMLVVAHPDDECLFFSPTLSTFAYRRSDVELSILVMSIGNNYGLGETRRKELQGSCEMFNVPASRCKAMNVTDIQDDPVKWWPVDEITGLIGEHVLKWDIDTIFTFDDGGISGHINHRAVSASVKQYSDTHENKSVFFVYTTAIIRKYTVWFDFAFTALPTIIWRCLPFTSSNKAYTIHTFGLWRVAYKAFEAHKSQWELPRTLFLYLNRYMWYNELIIYNVAR